MRWIQGWTVAVALAVFFGVGAGPARADVCTEIWGEAKPEQKQCKIEWKEAGGRVHGLEYRRIQKACAEASGRKAKPQDCGLVRECSPVQKKEGRIGAGRILLPGRMSELCAGGLSEFTLYDFDAVAILRCDGPYTGRIRLRAPAGALSSEGAPLETDCESGVGGKPLPSSNPVR